MADRIRNESGTGGVATGANKPMDSEQEIREFWEWCGFRLFEDDEGEWKGCFYWHNPANTEAWGKTWLPPIDPNNLSKYVIPKLLEKYDIKITSFWDALNNKAFWFVHLQDRISDEVEFDTVRGYEKLEDALFWICWEVIHG